MFVCAICHCETAADDLAQDLALGRHFRWCICLGCQQRESGLRRELPPRLAREVAAILTAASLHGPPQE